MLTLDWQGVLSGQPLQWVISGFLTTLWVTLAGVLLSTLLAIILLALRLSGNAFGSPSGRCLGLAVSQYASACAVDVLVLRSVEFSAP
ncbi:Uncharacterised protein [Citrobacter koseri]|uniref:ABC transporter permease n=1 Tax=Citrobacter koseri TaxID=545 RepID=A0A3S4MBW9_CITKO|nr:Uncharacterised protein [Citrobacter koseri]